VLIAGLPLVVSATAQAPSCLKTISGVSGAGADFDGDGKLDVAIGDPNATVSGNVQAGRVHIAYGNGSSQTILPNSFPNNDAGAGERFGFAMDTVDWKGDGCSDLFIGAPYENWSNNTRLEAGIVMFIPGSPAGLDLPRGEGLDLGCARRGLDQDRYPLRMGPGRRFRQGGEAVSRGRHARPGHRHHHGEMLVDIGAARRVE
jgi:hypothetical protein